MLKTKFPGVAKALKPLAEFYVNAAGYRKMGLRYDDLIVEERPDVQKVSLCACRWGYSGGLWVGNGIGEAGLERDRGGGWMVALIEGR